MPGMSQVIYQNGINEGQERELIDLVKDGYLTVDIAAQRLNKSPDEIQLLLNSVLASKRDEAE